MKWYSTKEKAKEEGGEQVIYIAKDKDSSGRKEYSFVKNHQHLSQVLNQCPCVYEIMTKEWREMYDFDGSPELNEQEVIQDFISSRKRISDEKVYIKSCSNHQKTSLHFIIPTTLFRSKEEMKNRFLLLMKMDLVYKEYYDSS